MRDFTAVGTPVNMAAFLEQHARGGRRILVSKLTREEAAGIIGPCPEHFDLKKPGQTVGGPYEYWVLRSPGERDRSAATTVTQVQQAAPKAPPAVSAPEGNHVSYSRKDREWLEYFQTMMSPLVRGWVVSVWRDGKIKPSQKWRHDRRGARGREGRSVTELAQYQAVHDVARPLNKLSEAARDDVLVSICDRLAEAARSWLS